ncbi:hypothetical protein AMK21_09295 [Streptomyces sp. CB00316]|nr:hypothetical protein AMK21_09295 [Streptomyces sp. CB00316]
MASADGHPRYIDYLYLAFTDATAFSPTDVMPLASWTKAAMGVQSLVSPSHPRSGVFDKQLPNSETKLRAVFDKLTATFGTWWVWTSPPSSAPSR